jgi:hypothetical protein
MQNPQPVQNEIANFNEYIRRLGLALGYPDDQIPMLINSFVNFNRQDRYKLITNTQQYVDSLLAVDQELASLPNGILKPYMQEIGENWNNMNQQLAQLQILSLIQKKEDCQAVIKELLRILNDKIRTVNDVLKANLGQSPSNPPQSGQSSSSGGINRFQDAVRLSRPDPNSGERFRQTVLDATSRFGPGRSNQGGGSNDPYINKYLKYKNKYLSLKKNSI